MSCCLLTATWVNKAALHQSESKPTATTPLLVSPDCVPLFSFDQTVKVLHQLGQVEPAMGVGVGSGNLLLFLQILTLQSSVL